MPARAIDRLRCYAYSAYARVICYARANDDTIDDARHERDSKYFTVAVAAARTLLLRARRICRAKIDDITTRAASVYVTLLLFSLSMLLPLMLPLLIYATDVAIATLGCRYAHYDDALFLPLLRRHCYSCCRLMPFRRRRRHVYADDADAAAWLLPVTPAAFDAADNAAMPLLISLDAARLRCLPC